MAQNFAFWAFSTLLVLQREEWYFSMCGGTVLGSLETIAYCSCTVRTADQVISDRRESPNALKLGRPSVSRDITWRQ